MGGDPAWLCNVGLNYIRKVLGLNMMKFTVVSNKYPFACMVHGHGGCSVYISCHRYGELYSWPTEEWVGQCMSHQQSVVLPRLEGKLEPCIRVLPTSVFVIQLLFLADGLLQAVRNSKL